ncbi:MAG: NADH-quinone oxidoreductase subunit N, partial [Gammaproteobacteria bacterium]
MSITTADLIYLLPMLIVTGTAVGVMLLIGIKRNYGGTAGVAVAGLLLATLSAATMIGDMSEQVTP